MNRQTYESGIKFVAVLCAVSLVSAQIQFIEKAEQAGLTDILYCGDSNAKKYIIETLGTGLALIDYNADGYPDLFAVNASKLEGFPKGREPINHLYRNNRDGTFTDVTRQAGLVRSGWGQGVCAGDFDNDGFDDLYVTYWGHDVLYHNTGKGTFDDVTEAAGLGGKEVRWGTGCAFTDYNLDGKLDLFVANYVQFDQQNTATPDSPAACKWKGQPVMCGPRGLKGGINRLFRNDSQPGKIRFTDVSKESLITTPGERYSLSVTTLDYDGDRRPDIYVAVDSQASILYHNNGDGTFTDTGVAAGVAYSEDGREQAGMGTAVADFDGDSRLDLIKTNFIDDTPNVYRNNGDGSFTEVTFGSGVGMYSQFLGWGIGFLDFDNDTWPDIFVVNGHVYPEAKDAKFHQRRILFRNLGSQKYKDVSAEVGTSVVAERSGRGLAIGDFDRDGDEDVFIMNMNDRPSLLVNEGGNRNNFLGVNLQGRKSNRDGIGARVTVVTGSRKLVNEVRSGSTFMSQSDLCLHFGLGRATLADRVEIEWPGGKSETISNVKANQFITITEGAGVSSSQAPHEQSPSPRPGAQR